MDKKETPKAKEEEPKVEPTETKEEPERIGGFNPMEMLNDPVVKSLLGGCKDMFKKEKPDPNICEIIIKAPSEVVLKLFKISDQ